MIYFIQALRTLSPLIFLLAFGLLVFAIGCNDSAVTEISQEDKVIAEHELVSEITSSDEFKHFNELGQKSLSMLFDALDNGLLTKESLSVAFKADAGLLDDEDVISLSRIFPIDHIISVNETARSVMEKFPALSEYQDEPRFSEACEVNNEKIDRFVENLSHLRDLPVPTASFVLESSILSKTSVDDECPECCRACGGGPGACGDMIAVYACGIVGVLSGGWWGAIGGLWLCGCAWCEEDLPCWACRTCRDG